MERWRDRKAADGKIGKIERWRYRQMERHAFGKIEMHNWKDKLMDR